MDFYPRPPRGGRLCGMPYGTQPETISIHALREEGDFVFLHQPPEVGNFYPRPPRGGRRTYYREDDICEIFLSTPSARRATRLRRGHPGHGRISIHALREEGDQRCRRLSAAWRISIHALREEGDPVSDVELRRQNGFLSTPSARRATPCAHCSPLGGRISIHALREEGDLAKFDEHSGNFISIHALREEGDRWTVGTTATTTKFLSTPSARRATQQPKHWHRRSGFLSTPSARRATLRQHCQARRKRISIHALREEGDFTEMPQTLAELQFLSTPSARRATVLL